MQRHSQGEPTEAALSDIPAPEILARLVPYLDMSVMVVRRDWSVSADLGPPGGVLGRGNATGSHPFSSMHPDDVERVAGYAQRAMESAPGWRCSFEVRAQRGNGSYGLFDIELHNRLDDPVIQGVVVVSRSLPDPQPADAPSMPAEVAATVQLGAGDHLPIGLLLLDSEGDVVFVNQMAADLMATDRDTLLDGFVPSGFGPEDEAQIREIIRRLRVAPGRESFTAALELDPPRLLSATFVSRAGEGTGDHVQFVVVTLEDVTHRLAHERHLEHRANHDSLTGLPNRLLLYDRLEQGTFQCSRGGHALGDDLLAEVAVAIQSSLHSDESAARVGGDEFVVVAPAGAASPPASLDEEATLRDRIRAAVLTNPGAIREQVGVSVGITRSRPGDEPWDLLGRADAAMYAEKPKNDR